MSMARLIRLVGFGLLALSLLLAVDLNPPLNRLPSPHLNPRQNLRSPPILAIRIPCRK